MGKSHNAVVTDQKLAWVFTDAVDDHIEEIVYGISLFLAEQAGLQKPTSQIWNESYYSNVDVGGLRDALIAAAEDMMDCELKFDYPC